MVSISRLGGTEQVNSAFPAAVQGGGTAIP